MAAAVTGCSTYEPAPGGPAPASERPELPQDYRFVLTSSCGERPLIGRYRVEVRDGAVQSAEPLQGTVARPELADVPTLAGLLDRADQAEAGAEVTLAVDDKGLPSSLNIDPSSEVTDDEECYEVTDVSPLRR
ncbi:DUF6174 domain-containing protein [Nocardioides sp. SYSU D00065]|uniref:DUF6174 domain-containing protein n=1 Tax=Nocardioides sp. SYSU D00065 TaxID=2817378 RepID=UPI001B321953|nr:DUF6174 domain-containing protein [Nocardioides sp. SYSU D00065]